MFLPTLAALFCVASCSHYYTLEKFHVDVESVLDVANGSTLYLSSHDQPEYLKNIYFDFGWTKADAYTLSKMFKTADGLRAGITVNTSVVVTSKNPNPVTSLLAGLILIVPPNKDIAVYDLTNSSRLVSNDAKNKTAVFFNFHIDEDPPLASQFHAKIRFDSNSDDSTFQIWSYIIDSNINSHILFRNPTGYTAGGTEVVRHFNHIEPLPVLDQVFTIVYSGHQNFTVDNSWSNDTWTSTTANTTTGLLAANYETLSNQGVVFTLSMDHYGEVGMVWYCFLSSPTNITMYGPNGNIGNKFTEYETFSEGSMTSPNAYYNITVSTRFSFAGMYYVQYYTYDLGEKPTTPTTPSTTTDTTTTMPRTAAPMTTVKVESTTKTANQTAVSFILACLLVKFYWY